jgi:parvulin-like peptidyl-prolyl isomerase
MMKYILKHSLLAAKFQGKNLVTQQDVDAKIKELGLQSAPRDQVFMHILMQLAEDKLLSKKMSEANIEANADFKELAKRNAEEFKKSYYLQLEAKKRITPQMRQAVYDQMRDAMKGKKEINPRIIVLTDENKACEVHTKLTKDATLFAELARAHSIDPSKDSGGLIGKFLPEDMFFPEVVKIIPSLKEGAPSKPIKASTPSGDVHIIMMIDKGNRRDHQMPEISHPEVAQQIEKILMRQMMGVVQNDLLRQIDVYDLGGNKMPLVSDEGQSQGIPLINGGVKK